MDTIELLKQKILYKRIKEMTEDKLILEDGTEVYFECTDNGYIMTNIEEREEPKKYKLKHKLAEDAYLNYFKGCIEDENKLIFANSHETGSFKTVFTIREWEALTEQTWEDLLLQFKAIEV